MRLVSFGRDPVLAPRYLLCAFVTFLLPIGGVLGDLAQSGAVPPLRDAPDLPFRRAPMGLSSRSIVVSLTTNLHLAFDAKLLRTHTVWEGAPLNLYGPPFNNTATRFICDFTGNLLWGNLPVQPWELAHPDGNGFDLSNTRFLGVSTKGDLCSFLYELSSDAGTPVAVRETPSGGAGSVARRCRPTL